MPFAPTLALNNGVAIPQLGMGLWQISNADMPKVVGAALDAGYRLFDTAVVYGNEVSLGQALKHAGVARNEIFVTTKLWNDEQGYERTLRAFDESLQRLGLDYVDLYLIHWPQPAKDRYVETWRALEKIYRAGKARAIGVSNFEPAQLERLLASGSIVPSVNQIELHPRLQQAALCAFDRAHGIVTESWSPLARGDLGGPVIEAIARKHGKTPAQVILRWHIERGLIAIPRSAHPPRIRENMGIFDFALDAEDMAKIARLDTSRRIGPDPATF
ncbi:MAG: aldo/keto reductase [Beijerinckiaceae bacterium]